MSQSASLPGELFHLLQRIPQPPRSFSGATTLSGAVSDRAAGTARYLVDRGVDVEDLQDALLAASFDKEMLRYVLEAAQKQNVELDFRPALEGAVRFADADIVRLLRENAPASQNFSDLNNVAPIRRLQRTAWLRGESKQAAIRRICEIVRDSRFKRLLDAPLEFDLTPLLEAARRGVDEVVDALLECGADPNLQAATDDLHLGGRTALTFAAELGRSEMLERLLRAGADPNLRDGRGTTALIYGAADPQIVRALLDAGADFRIVDQDGRGALKAACGIFRDEVRGMLRTAQDADDAGRPGEGVRFSGRPIPRSPGAADFLKLLGNRPFSVLAVRAPIEDVSTIYAETRGAAGLECDVVDQDREAPEEWAFLVRLRGDDWTVVLRTLDLWFWGDRFRTGCEALELSTFLNTKTVAATFDGMKCTAETYDDGTLLEEIRWEKDGELLFFRTADGQRPDPFGPTWEDLDAFFVRRGIFLPPAQIEIDAMRFQLVLHGLQRADVERVDLVVLF